MLDVKFLNEKATKFKQSIKKAKQIIDIGFDEFVKTPMYPDRVQYYMIIAYDELDQILCHILKEIKKTKKKEDCIKEVIDEEIFSGKVTRAIIDFKNFRDDVLNKGFDLSPKQMYFSVKNIIDNLYDQFIPELSSVVKELKSKEPKLAIPVNMKKVNDHAKAVKSAVKKIEVFLKYPLEEFSNNNMFIDRMRYFLTVAIDSSLWICRHILRVIKVRGKSCFDELYKRNIITKETADFIQDISDIRDKLINPEYDFDPEYLYKTGKESVFYFRKYIDEISYSILKGSVSGKGRS